MDFFSQFDQVVHSEFDQVFLSRFDQILAQYLLMDENIIFADHQTLASYFNNEAEERRGFWLAVGDLIELDGFPKLSEEIRNGVCVVSCDDDQHAPNCPLFPFNSHRPQSSIIPLQDLPSTSVHQPLQSSPVSTQVDSCTPVYHVIVPQLTLNTEKNQHHLPTNEHDINNAYLTQAKRDMKEHLDLDSSDDSELE